MLTLVTTKVVPVLINSANAVLTSVSSHECLTFLSTYMDLLCKDKKSQAYFSVCFFMNRRTVDEIQLNQQNNLLYAISTDIFNGPLMFCEGKLISIIGLI